MKQMVRGLGLGVVATAALVLAAPVSVEATHTHVMKVGNGKCVVIAEGAGEASVELPAAVFQHNPNVDIARTEGRSHPLHILVHQGKPGEHRQLYVMGSADASNACASGFVNR